MNYCSITENERAAMLAQVGVGSVDELFVDVPEALRMCAAPEVTGGWSEIDLAAELTALAGKNRNAGDYICFAGAGCYDHYRPAFIDHLLRRPEFFTAYTPYQPEVSQGTLQAIYEYQTGICELTGLDVANASMYDGATALAEAAFMAARLSRGKRTRVLVSETLHPEKIETLQTYASSGLIEPEVIPADDLITDGAALRAALADGGSEVAAVLLPYPNYYGIIEDLTPLIEAAHAARALVVLDTNPILLGVLKRPAALGADIAVGEGQALGNAMSFGGPGLGYFACKQACVRQMPGRLVGRTTDAGGQTGYVLTLATREQHIRREKATSNICSNHALNALAAGMYLAAVGSKGLRGIALDCVTKAHYLHDELLATGLFEEPASGVSDNSADVSFGYEFTLRYCGTKPLDKWHETLFERGYLAGVVVDRPSKPGMVLFAVTEQRTRKQVDALVKEVRDLG
jgi:glycine dehydrogenase subunit 1